VLRAWLAYAERVGRYEADVKDVPRVVALVAVTYVCMALGLSWPLFVDWRDIPRIFGYGVPFGALIIAIVSAIVLERFHAKPRKDTTHTRTVLALAVVAVAVACSLFGLPALLVFLPIWILFVSDALAHVTKVVSRAKLH
jgi:hypothetical protein